MTDTTSSSSSPEEPRADFLVAPRYLAGSDGDLHPVIDPLETAGWLSFSDERQITRYIAPHRRRCVAYLTEDHPSNRNSLFCMWHLWGRERPCGPATWNISSTSRCPTEIIGGITTALTAPPPPDTGEEDRGMQPLAEAGWQPSPPLYTPGFQAPRQQATVLYAAPPPNLRQEDLADTVTWLAEAITGPAPDTPVVWRATFTARTPVHLVTAFCAALADPEPLPRYPEDLDPDLRPHLRPLQSRM